MCENNRALINNAVIYATQCHSQQVRKGTELPYIIHSLEVMHILFLMGGRAELLAAGVLHDVVEDTDATLEDLEQKFGAVVAKLVASHTELHKELPWEERKQQALKEVAVAGKEEQQLVLADKLANIRAMVRDYNQLGEKLWERFKRGRKEQAWYYHGGVEALKALAQEEASAAFYEEFKALVYELYGEPEAHLNQEDLENADVVICENEEKLVRVIVEAGVLRLEGEEYGDKYSSSDNYEYTVEFNNNTTEKLLLELRKDFGQDFSLKEIFKEKICPEGRYYGLLRYCEKKNIPYNVTTF